MYRCIDERGNVKFTDMMESEACRPLVFDKPDTAFHPGGGYRGNSSITVRAAEFEDMIRYYGVRYDIDPHLIRAVIRTESGFNPRAVSSKGAIGLMQLMPGTAKDLKVIDPFDPRENIDGGTRYLRFLLDDFKQDLRLALAAYNAGPTLVKRIQNVPSYPETVQYVDRVLAYYRDYKSGRI
jgi:soluble lytic murein transglycosylase-like protein